MKFPCLQQVLPLHLVTLGQEQITTCLKAAEKLSAHQKSCLAMTSHLFYDSHLTTLVCMHKWAITQQRLWEVTLESQTCLVLAAIAQSSSSSISERLIFPCRDYIKHLTIPTYLPQEPCDSSCLGSIYAVAALSQKERASILRGMFSFDLYIKRRMRSHKVGTEHPHR